MVEPQLYPVAREVRDVYRRSYRIGESDRDLLGRSRRWILAAAWLAMFAVSAGQYGFGVILPALGVGHGWPVAHAVWLLPSWVACQALAVAVSRTGPDRVATAGMARRVVRTPTVSVLLGAVLAAGGLVALAYSRSFWQLALGYGVASGVGSGLVYGSCLRAVARWYPERATVLSAVTGAFGYGAIPVLVGIGVFAAPPDVVVLLDVTAVVVLVLVGLAAVVLRNPPPDWWPTALDPQVWAVDKSVNRGLRDNWPAIRRYTPSELLRCPAAWLMYAVVICVSAGCLFDIGYLAVFADRSGWGWPFAILVAVLFAAGSGMVRGPAGLACDRFGRRRVLFGAVAIGALGQLLLLVAARYGLPGAFVAGACLAGLGLGTGYALLPRVVAGFFGDKAALSNFGVLYSAKGIGGVLGVGVVAIADGSRAYLVGFVVAAALAVLCTALLPLLRQPGRTVLGGPVAGVVRS
ncbi:MAG TPA: MFS transporter [Pseudonocardiaceae bacterium]|jgi:MFS family permease|nr:MFS transporter [Pseudonocardiaceae bacterium]